MSGAGKGNETIMTRIMRDAIDRRKVQQAYWHHAKCNRCRKGLFVELC